MGIKTWAQCLGSQRIGSERAGGSAGCDARDSRMGAVGMASATAMGCSDSKARSKVLLVCT